MPFMVDAVGLGEAAAGLIASANFLGNLTGALLASSTALPGGRRGWLLTALAVSALTTGLMGGASSMAAFMALRFAGGVASAFVLVFASALVLDRLAVAGRSGLSAAHFAGVGCGIAVSAVLVSGLAALDQDWRSFWLAGGVVSVLALGVAAWLIPGVPETGPAPVPARPPPPPTAGYRC